MSAHVFGGVLAAGVLAVLVAAAACGLAVWAPWRRFRQPWWARLDRVQQRAILGDVRPPVTGRHASPDTAEWSPAHRARSCRWGRHHTGDRRWPRNLIVDTSALTTRELAQMLRTA